MGRKARASALIAVFGLLASGPGCFGRPGAQGEAGKTAVSLPVPTKDDVALVDGTPLSISGFLAIRSALKNPSVETVFWAGISAIALQNEARKAGRQLSAQSALSAVRYAMGELPAEEARTAVREFLGSEEAQPLPSERELRLRIEQLVARAVVQRNPQVLAELR